MSPTKAHFIITMHRKVSFTDQIFLRWPGFNDPRVRRTLSSTAHSHEVRQYKWNTPKHKSPVDTESKTFFIEWQASAMCRKSLIKKQCEPCAFYDAPNPALLRERHTSATEAKGKGPRSIACHSFKALQWLIFTILLQAPLAIFYCCLVLYFHPIHCSC